MNFNANGQPPSHSTSSDKASTPAPAGASASARPPGHAQLSPSSTAPQPPPSVPLSGAPPPANGLSGLQIVKSAFGNTHKHFWGLIKDISFSVLLTICVFVPMWVLYIKIFGLHSQMVMMFEWAMLFSVSIVVLFMLSFSLFNRTHSRDRSLKLWPFTKDITLPWLVEGIKALIIVVAGCFLLFIPGVVKYVHYTFFHFVVFFNKDYRESKVDALERSKDLTRGLRWWLLFLIVIPPNVIGFLPGWTAKMVFPLESLWVVYPLLMLCVYIACLGLAYCLSVAYFMYAFKDKDSMIGGSLINTDLPNKGGPA